MAKCTVKRKQLCFAVPSNGVRTEDTECIYPRKPLNSVAPGPTLVASPHPAQAMSVQSAALPGRDTGYSHSTQEVAEGPSCANRTSQPFPQAQEPISAQPSPFSPSEPRSRCRGPQLSHGRVRAWPGTPLALTHRQPSQLDLGLATSPRTCLMMWTLGQSWLPTEGQWDRTLAARLLPSQSWYRTGTLLCPDAEP